MKIGFPALMLGTMLTVYTGFGLVGGEKDIKSALMERVQKPNCDEGFGDAYISQYPENVKESISEGKITAFKNYANHFFGPIGWFRDKNTGEIHTITHPGSVSKQTKK